MRLEQAVEAYRAALEVFADDDSLSYRDLVQDNIARAIEKLRERKTTTGLAADPD